MWTRREVLKTLAAGSSVLAMPWLRGASGAEAPSVVLKPAAPPAAPALRSAPETRALQFNEALASVVPEIGHSSRIRLGASMLDLVRHRVIDRSKLEKLYAARGGFPTELKTVLARPSKKPIHLTRQNAGFYMNLLWPLGISNFMTANKRSPVHSMSLLQFASTAGWTLGKQDNGGHYFNTLRIVKLTPEQEALVVRVAESTYRPCCDNSTFFQDCNHGSALLGLLQLGASQGLTEAELYHEALVFNSFWFPDNYLYNALYFKAVRGEEWASVDPKVLMGRGFSSASGNARIRLKVAKIPDLIPRQIGRSEGCAA